MPFPEPPPGYFPAIQFEYPKRPLQIGGTVLAIILIPLLILVAVWLHDGRLTNIFGQGIGGILIMVLTIGVTILIHELVHGFVYRLLGYKVTYGMDAKLVAAYAAAFQQFQKRNHNLIVALAPLFVLTPIGLWLMASDNLVLALVGYIGLLFNTSGAVGDLYLTWRLLRWPSATLLYDVDPATMLVYLPQA